MLLSCVRLHGHNLRGYVDPIALSSFVEIPFFSILVINFVNHIPRQLQAFEINIMRKSGVTPGYSFADYPRTGDQELQR